MAEYCSTNDFFIARPIIKDVPMQTVKIITDIQCMSQV